MPVTINASPTNGLVSTADGSGVMKLQSNGVTTNALAWVNFNGTGTVAINSSYNVSSITDNATGDYTVNFATALSDANYAACVSGTVDVASTTFQFCAGIRASSGAVTSKTSSGVRVISSMPTGSTVDSQNMNVAIFGN